MVDIIKNIPVYLPDVLNNIDEKSFRQYMMWQDDQKLLNKYPISKFTEALLSTLPYTDENRPEQKVKEDGIKIGELEFLVITTQQAKRTSYKSVYDKFKTFVESLQEFYNDERLRKDFRTLAPRGLPLQVKELYVNSKMVKEKLEEYVSTSLEGKEGIRQEVKLVKPEQILTSTPEIMHINLERDYRAVAESNGRAWQEAQNMVEEGSKRTIGFQVKGTKEYVKRFKKLVLEDSLQVLGGIPKTPVALMYPFPTISFKHQIEPREIVAYEPIIDSFLKEVPKVIKSNSRIGDLVLINLIHEGKKEWLQEKKVLSEEFLKDYDPQKEDDKTYIRIEGLKKRLQEHTKKNTTLTIEQNFSIILPRT
ncbi:MAG: hypothetical protein QW404_00430 [Candidatus Nanoarchaeia archaeon]